MQGRDVLRAAANSQDLVKNSTLVKPVQIQFQRFKLRGWPHKWHLKHLPTAWLTAMFGGQEKIRRVFGLVQRTKPTHQKISPSSLASSIWSSPSRGLSSSCGTQVVDLGESEWRWFVQVACSLQHPVKAYSKSVAWKRVTRRWAVWGPPHSRVREGRRALI